MRESYTVISFGNYETKILCCSFIENTLYPIYKKSFITKNCFQESHVIDEELLIKTLQKELKPIPIPLKQTNLILNIPLKKLDIINSKKDNIPINSDFTIANLINLVENYGNQNIASDKIELEKKVIYWRINNKSFSYLPDLPPNLSSFGWNINTYLTKKNVVDKYKSIFYEQFDLVPKMVTCDSLVMSELFFNKERKVKVLINIGHLKTIFESYENEVLINQTSYDFGIRHLTSEIGKIGNINETDSIELLKIYKMIANFDSDLALINHFKQKYLDYSQTKIHHISYLIQQWIKYLVDLLNYYLKNAKLDFLGVDEIYLYSSMNILEKWHQFIKKNMEKRADIFAIESGTFSINENKYCSLVASVYHYVNSLKKNSNFLKPTTKINFK
ncbi:MAG: hypothetical protein HUJ42_02205 [Malacoplasma sp.]|nr:hypothetical protein [Malacoplasma sp.]